MPTNKPTPAQLNALLAERLGVDLRASTDNDIVIALGSWWDQCDPRWGTMIGLTSHLTVWRNREGKPYQQEIEDWVAAWRKEPPDWAGDLVRAFELQERIWERGLGVLYASKLRGVLANTHQRRIDDFDLLQASAYDRALAAWLAVGGVLDE